MLLYNNNFEFTGSVLCDGNVTQTISFNPIL